MHDGSRQICKAKDMEMLYYFYNKAKDISDFSQPCWSQPVWSYLAEGESLVALALASLPLLSPHAYPACSSSLS